MNRVFLIVLDSVGIGALPDAHKYGDEGSNTLGNTAKAVGGLNLPNMDRLGLNRVLAYTGGSNREVIGQYGRMAEASAGKDTTTGHWEMMGIILEKAFPTYPDGFPTEVLEAFEKAVGTKTLGNKAASGTVIIDELGEEHMKTGYPIVYTSADSVFQIAAHEEIIPIERLYEMCEIARDILVGDHAVGRVIARPFEGEPGAFKRTTKRHDYSLKPIESTVLDRLKEKGINTFGIGKIYDIFAGEGISKSFSSGSNAEGMEVMGNLIQDKGWQGLAFVNLVDFDMLYGHRNNPEGYAKALEEFDQWLGTIIPEVSEEELLIITADHGCDPTTESTDHSREYVPLLVYQKGMEAKDLGTRETFSDIGATIANIFKIEGPNKGKSFLS